MSYQHYGMCYESIGLCQICGRENYLKKSICGFCMEEKISS
jgi:hypothetical protein